MAGGSPGNQSNLSGCGPPSFYSSPGSSPEQANISGNAGAPNLQAGGSPGTSPQQNANTPCGSAPAGPTAPNMSSSSSPGSGTSPAGNNPVGNVSPGRVVCVGGSSPGRMVAGGSPQGGGTQGLSPPQFLNNSGGAGGCANSTAGSDTLNMSIPNVSAVIADMSNLSDNSRSQSPGCRQAGPSPVNRSVPQPSPSPQQPCDPQQSRFYYPGRVTSPGANNSYSFDTSGALNRNITLEGTMDNILQNNSNIPAYQFEQLTESNAAYWMQPGHVGFPLQVEKRQIPQTPPAPDYLAQSTPVAIQDRYRQPAWRYVNASPIHPPTPAGPQNYSGYSFLNDSALLEGNISDWADPYRDRSLNYSQNMPSTYSPPPRPEPFPADRIIETPPRGCDISAGSPDYRMASSFRTPSPQRPGDVSAGSPDYRMASFFRTPPPQRPLDMSSGSPDYRMASFFRTPPPQRPLDVSAGSPDYRMASFFRTPPPQRPMDVSAGSPDCRLASFFRTPPPQRPGDVSAASPDYRMASFFRTPPPQRPADVSFDLQSSAEASRSAGSPGTGASTTHTFSVPERSTGAESSGARAAGQTFNVSPAGNESGRGGGGGGCCGPPPPNAASPRGPGGSPASARGFSPGELPSYLGGSPARSGPAGSAVMGGPTFNLGSLLNTPRRPPSIGPPNMPSALDLFSSCFELLLRRIMMGNMVPVVNDLIEQGIWPWRFCDCPRNQNRINTMDTMMVPMAHSTPNPRNGTPAGGTYTRLFDGLPNPPFPPASWLAERQQGLEQQQQQENSRNTEADSSLATGFSYLSRMEPMADPTFLGGGAPPGPPPPACPQACGGQPRASPQQPPPQQVLQPGNRSLRMPGPQPCAAVQRPYQSLNALDRTNASNPEFNGDSYF